MPHEHHKGGVGREHPRTHSIIAGSIVFFMVVCVLDTQFLHLSTQLASVIPPYIRLASSTIIFAIALVLLKLSHKAVFTTTDEKQLKKSGIFAHVRNPMYLSTPLIFAAIVVLTTSLISLVPIVFTFIAFTKMVKFEEADLERIFGRKYLEYKEKVPRWLPRLSPAKFNE
ncbi:MAG: methyltransferase family protein [Promethearchaeota archaeon]